MANAFLMLVTLLFIKAAGCQRWPYESRLLKKQMTDDFDRGPVNDDIGGLRDVALDASRRLEIKITRMIACGMP
jgi:hypothetical protein